MDQFLRPIIFEDHYWEVVEKEAIYSSKEKAYIGTNDAGFQSWEALGGQITKIATELELREVFAVHYPEGWPADFLVSQARTRLALNDAVFVRCGKAGIEYNAEWRAFDETLRAIVNGTSELTALPSAPAYPS